ncbi:uncharacterized protein ACNS7B_003512 [Menidia menidia]
MSAGTVVTAGGILAAVILLTIVAVLCLCRLQYYCCKGAESEKGEEPELCSMSPSRPLALCAPPTPPSPERFGEEPEAYPPTFLTEAFGPLGDSPPRRCPSCARAALPFCLQPPAPRRGYRALPPALELPAELASFYEKLNLLRSYTVKEVVTHSISTDV